MAMRAAKIALRNERSRAGSALLRAILNVEPPRPVLRRSRELEIRFGSVWEMTALARESWAAGISRERPPARRSPSTITACEWRSGGPNSSDTTQHDRLGIAAARDTTRRDRPGIPVARDP
jgi:hypothetical protein